MTNDLMIPIVFLMIGIVLIDAFDNILPLLILGLLYIPIAWLFTYQVYAGTYVYLFSASISGYSSNLPYFNSVLACLMFGVPISAFAKVSYLKHFVTKEEDTGDNYGL